MGEFLSDDDLKFKEFLKSLGIITPTSSVSLQSKKGGVKCVCGDGRRDIITFHKKEVHSTTTLYTPPGGPLIFSREFMRLSFGQDGFSPEEVEVIMRSDLARMKKYMGLIATGTVFDTFHYPCAAAQEVGIDFKSLMTQHVLEVVRFFNGLCKSDPDFFCREKTHFKLHLSLSRDEQKTYLIALERLRRCRKCLELFGA